MSHKTDKVVKVAYKCSRSLLTLKEGEGVERKGKGTDGFHSGKLAMWLSFFKNAEQQVTTCQEPHSSLFKQLAKFCHTPPLRLLHGFVSATEAVGFSYLPLMKSFSRVFQMQKLVVCQCLSGLFWHWCRVLFETAQSATCQVIKEECYSTAA